MAHSDKLKLSSFPQIPISLPPISPGLQNFTSQATLSQLSSIQSLLGKRDLLHGPLNEDLSLEKKVKVEQQECPYDLSSLTRQDTDIFRTHNRDPGLRNMSIINNAAHQDYFRLQALQQAQYLKVMASLNNQAHLQNPGLFLQKSGINADAIIPSHLLNSAVNKMKISNPVFKVEDEDDNKKAFTQGKMNDLSRPKLNVDNKISSKEKKNRVESYTNINQEPILAEFTREYPDWDLATIFEFIKSGKPREVFEGERRTRLKNKTRKERRKVILPEKSVVRNGIVTKK